MGVPQPCGGIKQKVTRTSYLDCAALLDSIHIHIPADPTSPIAIDFGHHSSSKQAVFSKPSACPLCDRPFDTFSEYLPRLFSTTPTRNKATRFIKGRRYRTGNKKNLGNLPNPCSPLRADYYLATPSSRLVGDCWTDPTILSRPNCATHLFGFILDEKHTSCLVSIHLPATFFARPPPHQFDMIPPTFYPTKSRSKASLSRPLRKSPLITLAYHDIMPMKLKVFISL